jgi:hypothetical protein
MSNEPPEFDGLFGSVVDDPSTDGAEPGSGAAEDDESIPKPGQLRIHQKRSWRSWQLAATALVAVIIGMWINGDTGGGSASAGSGGSSTQGTLPPDAGTSGGTGASTSSTVPKGGAATKGRSATTTTVAGGAGATTTTTVAGASGAAGATSTTQPLGQESYLVPAYQSTGNWTSPAFNIAGGTWYLGWAFACNPVPAAKPTFAVYVVPSGGSPSGTPAVTSSDPQGQSVTNLTSTGSQSIAVQAPPQCKWVVKVTGYGGG